MYQVVISTRPVRCLTADELKKAPVVLIGDAKLVAKRFPTCDFPTLVGGVIVESPNKEHLHYISLLEWDDDMKLWRPALEDPRHS